MDELIDSYIRENYTQELASEIMKSFILFNNFNYSDTEQSIAECINNESYSTSSTTSDIIFIKVMKDLDFIINEHKIKLIPEATISEKNEILQALYLLQELENYEPVISLLESLESDEEKLSLIISDISSLSQEEVIRLIDSFDPATLNILKQFIYSKETKNDEIRNDDITKNLIAFAKFMNSNITNSLVEGIKAGAEFSTYLSFILEHITNENIQNKSTYIITLIYMSIDGYLSPLETYRKYSLNIFNDLNKINEVEVLLIKIINNFNEYKVASDEKTRLSQVSNT